MDFELTEEQGMVRETVRDFMREKIAPRVAEYDESGEFPQDNIKELAELGLMGMTIPEEYGGGGADTLAYAIAVEELTRVDSSVAITMAAHHSLGTLPIYNFGNDAQKEQWLPELASGKKLAAFGLLVLVCAGLMAQEAAACAIVPIPRPHPMPIIRRRPPRRRAGTSSC